MKSYSNTHDESFHEKLLFVVRKKRKKEKEGKKERKKEIKKIKEKRKFA